MASDWIMKDSATPQGSSNGFFYDLCEGYIKPGELLADASQVLQVEMAVACLQGFRDSLEEAELINEF